MIAATLTAKAVLSALGMMALQGTVLALIAVVLVRGKLRPAWQAAVWTIVMAKFALPWSPALPWSLADVLAGLRGASAGGPIVVGAPTGTAGAANVSSVWLIALTIWLAGAAIVLVRANRLERRALLAARRAPRAPAAAVAVLAELHPRARLVVGPSTIGPHVVGLLHPIIVVPPALVEPANREPLRAALLHELAHVRRLDVLGRLLQVFARAAFWWFPVVGLASRRLDHARESACDARALEVGRLSRPAYARLLLDMARLQPAAAVSLAAHAHRGTLEDRVSSVLGPPMRARLGIVHGVALLAFAAMALGGARSAEACGAETCVYTPQLAESLRQAHPEADVDNDGVLSHDEACEFQAELRRTAAGVSTLDEASAELLIEPLCCNSDAVEGTYAPSCRAPE